MFYLSTTTIKMIYKVLSAQNNDMRHTFSENLVNNLFLKILSFLVLTVAASRSCDMIQQLYTRDIGCIKNLIRVFIE